MKKIGIFTYMQTNYGAVLQAYALQHYLQSTGNDVEIINFTTKQHLVDHKVFKRYPTNWIKNIILNAITAFWYALLRRREKRNLKFKKSYYNFSPLYSTPKDILDNPPQKDVYVTGSDQVFNLNSPYYEVYYLNFIKGKSRKVAYAPSFGISSFSDEHTKRILPYLRDFDALSCREESGAAYLAEIMGEKVPTVVDPVMLLSPDEWRKVAVVKPSKKYILVYDLNGGKDLISIAKQVQKVVNMPIYCLTGNYMSMYSVEKKILDAGPSEFVGYFSGASFVVTDSFHGTCFSLIFSVPFLTYIAVKQTSARIESVLGRTGLKDRIIYDVDGFKWENSYLVAPKVDLEEFSSSSKDYLINAIEANEVNN